MRKFSGWLPALLVLALASCAASKNEEVVVAGVVYLEDQFMKLLSLGYQDAAKDAGVKCLLGNTGNDQAKEVELINTYLAQKVNGIAIAPLNQATSVPVLKKAADSVKIATTDSELTDTSFIVGGYTSDNKNLGRTTGEAAAQFIKEKFGGNAKIAIIQFKSLLPLKSADRVNGFLEAVREVNPNVQIVADQDAWMQDTAVQTAGDILTAHSDVDIIYAANDGGTIGSVMAVKNAGLAGKCFVFGIDIGDQQLAMLRDGDNILQAVTGQDPYQMGYNAMKALIDSIQDKDITATKGKNIIVPGILVNRGDPAGIQSFEENLRDKISRS
jgi:simple sugar transport system substrate-binding protein/ribose transport system substrate-binding protein